MRRFLLFLAAALLCGSTALAQSPPYSGLIATSRAHNWLVTAGLPATLPSGETTTNPWTPPPRLVACATLHTSDFPGMTSSNYVAPTALTTAEATCASSPGEYIHMVGGPYYFNAALPCGDGSYTTIRGDYTNVIFMQLGSARGCDFGSKEGSDFLSGVTAITSGFTVGSNQIVVPSGTYVAGKTIVNITQCDSGFSSYPTCGTGQTQDPGDFYIGEGGSFNSYDGGGSGGGNDQWWTALVTAVSGTGPFTLTLDKNIYQRNLSSSLSVSVISYNPTHGQGLFNGIEDITLDINCSTSCAGIYWSYDTYGSWAKGVRVIASGTGMANFNLFSFGGGANAGTGRNLIMSSYGVCITYNQGFNYAVRNSNDSDDMIVNTIIDNCAGNFTTWSQSGTVWAYSGLMHSYGGGGSPTTVLDSNNNHHASNWDQLFEGVQFGQIIFDAIHGTGTPMPTIFRSDIFGTDVPYNRTVQLLGVQAEAYSRFGNYIGNVMGSPTAGLATYITTPSSGGSKPEFQLGMRPGFVPVDPLTSITSFLWGNYSTALGAVQFNNGDVPSALDAYQGFNQSLGTGNGVTTTFSGTLSNTCVDYGVGVSAGNLVGGWEVTLGQITGIGLDSSSHQPDGVPDGTGISSSSINCATGAISVTFTVAPANGQVVRAMYLHDTGSASSYQNPVPATHNIVASFLFGTTAKPTCGTGLSWWLVTNYPTNSTTYCVPYPAIGPDVTGGGQPGVGAHAYEIPVKVAWNIAPIDTFHQISYSISSSSWSTNVETLNFAGGVLPGSTLAGEFQLTGACAGTYLITGSSSTSITFATTTNFGTSCGGVNFNFPDVRTWDERMFITDTGSNSVVGPAGPAFTMVPDTLGTKEAN